MHMNRSRIPARGFTLIELLVVVAIIALLLAILLPSLNSAREQAKAVKCGSNLRGVGQAVHQYLAEYRAIFPAAYQYLDGDAEITYVPGGGPGGYRHWSFELFSSGQVKDEFFECPSFPDRGGVPRTNPGEDRGDWNDSQVDQNGQTNPNQLQDKQAPRMAYTANAAIMPRNKWTTEMSFGQRVNRYVRETEIRHSADTILVTEFNRNWEATAIRQGGQLLSKSHRPVNPFHHASTGYDEYRLASAGFRYAPSLSRPETYGLAPFTAIESGVGLIDGARGSELNAVGRHHPGGDEWGGATNFLFVDGHVEKMPIIKSLQDRKWGEKYYSVTGDNNVYDRYGELRD
jgi:prepilin-type N-terminal cleavage/methylation domain-containing protein/prepilin-type processing-associated H-X9-DG protein